MTEKEQQDCDDCKLTPACCDVPCDMAGIALTDSSAGHTLLMEETRANGSMVHNVFRSSAAAKFRDVDPIESAATEAILNGVAINDR